MKKLALAVCVNIFSMSSIFAGSFDAGLKALDSGDYKAAFKEFIELAEQGDATAQFTVGVMYAGGDGVQRDYKQAINWYLKAAGQGHAMAQQNLGGMYASGSGVSQDQKQATSWYLKAAEQGDVRAQHNLGVRYAQGQGISADLIYAHMWLNLAASAGDEASKKALSYVAQAMTSEEILKANSKSKACVLQKYKDC